MELLAYCRAENVELTAVIVTSASIIVSKSYLAGWMMYVKDDMMAGFKLACKFGFHRYASCGWAERMCVWCLRWEENLYSNGDAKWTVKDGHDPASAIAAGVDVSSALKELR